MRAILFAFAGAAALAHAQAPRPDTYAAYIEREGCASEMFHASAIRTPVFPELKDEMVLAICFFETEAKGVSGTAFLAKHQELRLIDPATLVELGRHDVGCCSRRIVITLKAYPNETSNPVKNNPRPMSDALRAMKVTRSANIYVDEDGGATAHEFRVKDGEWQRLFYH